MAGEGGSVPEFKVTKVKIPGWQVFLRFVFLGAGFAGLVGLWVSFFSGLGASQNRDQIFERLKSSRPGESDSAAFELVKLLSDLPNGTLSANEESWIFATRLDRAGSLQPKEWGPRALLLGYANAVDKAGAVLCETFEVPETLPKDESISLFLGGLGRLVERGFFIPRDCFDSLIVALNGEGDLSRRQFLSFLNLTKGQYPEISKKYALEFFQTGSFEVRFLSLMTLGFFADTFLDPAMKDRLEEFSEQLINREHKLNPVVERNLIMSLLEVLKSRPQNFESVMRAMEILAKTHPDLTVRSEILRFLK